MDDTQTTSTEIRHTHDRGSTWNISQCDANTILSLATAITLACRIYTRNREEKKRKTPRKRRQHAATPPENE